MSKTVVPISYHQIPVTLDSQESNQNDEKFFELRNSPKYSEVWKRVYKKVKIQIRLAKLYSRVLDVEYEKIMGSYLRKNTLDEESLARQKESNGKWPLFVVDPNGKLYIIWLGLISIILLYIATIDLFISSFLDDGGNDTLIIDVFIDFAFIIDFFMNLHLAYYNEDGILVKEKKQIASKYLKGWMIIDACSSVPLGIINLTQGSKSYVNGLIKLVRLRNLPKLLKLGKIIKIINRLLDFEDLDYLLSKYHNLLRFIKVALSVFLCIHIVSCLFYMTAKLDNFGPNTWVVRYKYTESTLGEKYETCVYWAITTLTTVGYGDIFPFTFPEKLLAMIWMITGVYVVSFSVGSLSSFYRELEMKDNQVSSYMKTAEDFTKEVRISNRELYKLKRAIHNFPFNAGEYETEKFLQSIPIKLRYEIALNIYNKSIPKFEFFANKPRGFIVDIALRLTYESHEPEHILWRENEAADGIYFILEGAMKYKSKGTYFSSLHNSHYFGDIEIVYETERKNQIECALFTSLLKMNIQVIDIIKKQYPNIWEEIKVATKLRTKKLIQNLAEMLLIKKINETGGMKFLSFNYCKENAEEMFLDLLNEIKSSKINSYHKKLKLKFNEARSSLNKSASLMEKLEKIYQ
ncbi:hypothetical protein SteCoe_36165 [Stentor coeruleus]|uniref:Cyclic nucleotide-binding domain-containing protein n=1 Tax=Stentor coeruleus TaxID=5963 RepID=A0A1R2AR17_9CILI|nr:hypothetical protein SteCoe_36165 [Stentor coeruleus]